MRNKKGFTLIELLVVIAIIGLLATLSVVALNNARQKSRDAKRVSDIKQIQTALELYFVDNNGYPVTGATAVNLGDASNKVLCDTTVTNHDGFEADATAANCGTGTVYMGQVPLAPKPPTPQTYYTYCNTNGTGACDTNAKSRYKIAFTLEGATGGLSAGANCATPDGISSGACP